MFWRQGNTLLILKSSIFFSCFTGKASAISNNEYNQRVSNPKQNIRVRCCVLGIFFKYIPSCLATLTHQAQFIKEALDFYTGMAWWLSLQWRHNKLDGVPSHQSDDCLLNRLYRRRSKKHSSSASLAFVRGIHRWPVNSPYKGPVTWQMFPFDNVILVLLAMGFQIWAPLAIIILRLGVKSNQCALSCSEG